MEANWDQQINGQGWIRQLVWGWHRKIWKYPHSGQYNAILWLNVQQIGGQHRDGWDAQLGSAAKARAPGGLVTRIVNSRKRGQGRKRQRGQRGWPQFLATILASIYLNQEFPPAMSAKIMLDNILASSAPASFCDQMCFEVTFTALEPTSHPICWKITYVGSAYNEEFDQTLEEFEIDPIEASGTMKFDIACKAPDASRIPRKELISVTALLITASYREQEFIRVGYYIHNQLVAEEGQEAGLDELPTAQLVKRVRRTIISDKPRVTKFNIQWSDKKKVLNQDSQQSKLSDFFSLSGKSQGEQESSSQKLESKELHQKQSTLEESEIMIAE